MFSGNKFAFSDVEAEYIPEKLYWSQGQADPNAAGWPHLFLICYNQCSIHCIAEFNAAGYILSSFSLMLCV